MSEPTTTRVERVSYRKRETSTLVLEADNASLRRSTDGKGLVLELFRYGSKGEPVESYQFHLAPEDAMRLKHEAARLHAPDA